ncbi:MAG: alkaline phosphatase D family protein [Rhodospirillales bacterium]|nr:alkaline phosphatase D family protein [Rhodospirillales bacterium]
MAAPAGVPISLDVRIDRDPRRLRPTTAQTLRLTRRSLLAGAAAGAGLAVTGGLAAPAIGQRNRPLLTHGVQSGDVGPASGVVWARADRPARMMVEIATTESFRDARLLRGPDALEDSDFTAKLELSGLPAGQTVFYRVRFLDLGDLKSESEPTVGRFRTAPIAPHDIRFVWAGDTAGQGWGINRDWGGIRAFASMRRLEPDFFINSGDSVYADSPIPPEITLADGTIWKNLVTPEKSKVAETLAEFRGQYKYNLLDDNVRRFAAEVPTLAQWDDHETVNNWYSGEILGDGPYTERNVSILAARAGRAFHEFMPIRPQPGEQQRIYRRVRYGPALDVFILDMRSYRGANGPNDQPAPGPESAFLGAEQLAWLKGELIESTATWKVIAADMPIGLVRSDGPGRFEAIAQGNGPPLGREHEIADLLATLKAHGVKNTVWLTADVHYTAAHYYDPTKARFSDFDGFWEFVSGPLHAATGSTAELDDSFGPQVVFEKSAEHRRLGPADGLQFFGEVHIAGRTRVMTVILRDLEGAALYSVELEPKA